MGKQTGRTLGWAGGGRDLALLTLLCVPLYFLAPTSHGLTNWQEGIRALAASEMAAAGDWLTPTVDGAPYLAKPPLIYLCQLSVHDLIPRATFDLVLRLVVAIFGTLGVLATYLGARTLLGEPLTGERPEAARARARVGARWAALFLATGVLHVRSSRIGELDVLLVAPTLLALAMFLVAWDRETRPFRERIVPIGLATLGAVFATLTKGPPALLVIGLATVGAVFLRAAVRAHLERSVRTNVLVLASVFGVVALVLTLGGVSDIRHLIAAAAFAGFAFGGVLLLARLATPRATMDAFRTLSRTHPVAILALPLAALWGWYSLVDARTPEEALATGTAAKEAADNLVLLHLDAPHDNLEALLFAVGVGSPLALIGAWALVRERLALTRGLWIVVAWVGLSLVAFSVLGRGTPRYLTPVWPGIAILAGHWLSMHLRHLRLEARQSQPTFGARATIGGIVLALAVFQTWWYASGRQAHAPQRTCREFVREVLAHPDVPEGAPFASIDFWEPASALYAGQSVMPIADQSWFVDYPHEEWSLEGFAVQVLRLGTPWVVLVPERAMNQNETIERTDPAERLRAVGLELEQLEIEARFACDRKDNYVRAFLVTASEIRLPTSDGTDAPDP